VPRAVFGEAHVYVAQRGADDAERVGCGGFSGGGRLVVTCGGDLRARFGQTVGREHRYFALACSRQEGWRGRSAAEQYRANVLGEPKPRIFE
jgi:hypothetical protein